MAFFDDQPGEVRRRCKDCQRVNVVEREQIGTRCRCAACGALLYPDEVPGSTRSPAPTRVREPGREDVHVQSSGGGGLRFIIGLLLVGGAWGYVGGQQARQVGYTCEAGVGEACWVWKRSSVGRLADQLDR